MTSTKKQAVLMGLFLVALVLVLFGFSQTDKVWGESFTGTAANIVSATTTTVGPDTVVTLFSINTSCDSRIITTHNQGIRISFRTITGFTPTASAGHFQAASTTVAYNSGIYGCGLLTASGLDASSTVTISETQ